VGKHGYYRDEETETNYVMARVYDPSIIRWLSRDAALFAEITDLLAMRNGYGEIYFANILADNAHPYRYCGLNPNTYIDMTGLRKVVIQYFYYFTDTTLLAELNDVKKEVERIFQECFKKCIPVNCDGKPEHTVVFQWTKVDTRKEFDEKRKEFGWVGGGLFGGNPEGVNVGGRDQFTGGALGQSGNWAFNMNPRKVIDTAKTKGKDVSDAFATTIAHESGLHIIGGKLGHFHDKDFVDATAGKVGGVFSKEACDLICDKMDIE
jgi:RHS repeat-associated protein